MYSIIDRFNKETVATRKTKGSAVKWAKGLNDGLAMFEGVARYAVTFVEVA